MEYVKIPTKKKFFIKKINFEDFYYEEPITEDAKIWFKYSQSFISDIFSYFPNTKKITIRQKLMGKNDEIEYVFD